MMFTDSLRRAIVHRRQVVLHHQTKYLPDGIVQGNHGFGEFFRNLYHLNAEEEPEMYDYYREKDFSELRKAVEDLAA